MTQGHYFDIPPEALGALTDTPILSDDAGIDDDGEWYVHGAVWWFPNYMIADPCEELARKGRVVLRQRHAISEIT